MTLLSVVKDVCAAVGVTIPTSVFSNITGNRTMQEMLSLANEMAQRIAYDTRDWQKFMKTQTFTGTGAAASFDMPADYKRMLLTANVWRSTSALQPMIYVADYEEWLQRRAYGWFSPYGEWIRIGDKMLIAPTLPAGVTVYFAYMHKNCINLAAGGLSDTFVADNDTYGLDERVLKLGMIWQWKANKGAAYAEDMGTYGDAISKIQGNDKPAPILIGSSTRSIAVSASYPYPIQTP
jgi:hypothetical protein